MCRNCSYKWVLSLCLEKKTVTKENSKDMIALALNIMMILAERYLCEGKFI